MYLKAGAGDPVGEGLSSAGRRRLPARFRITQRPREVDDCPGADRTGGHARANVIHGAV